MTGERRLTPGTITFEITSSTIWPRQALTVWSFESRYARLRTGSFARPFATTFLKYHCRWHFLKVRLAEYDQRIIVPVFWSG
jgi:hypothetical protein